MKKTVLILAIVMVLTFMLTLTASATKPEHVKGFVPLSSVGDDGVDFWYDVCDEYLVGHVVQPWAPDDAPPKAVHGTFTAGNIPDAWGECAYTTTELEGTCEITLIPVEEFGNPESKKGLGVMGRCTGDLKGYQGRYVIHEWYDYDAWYHIDP